MFAVKSRHLLYGCIVVAGVLVSYAAVQTAPYWPPFVIKLRGKAPHCPWNVAISALKDDRSWYLLSQRQRETFAVTGRDETLDLVEVSTRHGRFWIKHSGTQRSGIELAAYLLAEHQMFAEKAGVNYVRHGDTVIDCGAHVGVFTRFALDAGARQVIAIEPDPVNLECLRRNVAGDSRVTLIPKAVWSEETESLELLIASDNSGGNRVVRSHQGHTVRIAATTLDSIVRDLRLTRVDFVKLDIEGAERHALRGASRMLQNHHPRLLLDSYHVPDDASVLPSIIRETNAGYDDRCLLCEMKDGQLTPHALLFF